MSSTEIGGKQKERVQFDFSQDALQRLDVLKEETQASTRAEMVRNALRLCDWLVSQVKELNTSNKVSFIEVETTMQEALRLYKWLIDEANRDSTIKIFDENNELTTQVKAKLFLK